ncbi:MAG: trehalose-6-phosphate synthase [Nitriliruptorales bacterium]|nr:trehalose-6-phosphate synthase [Nitriliruptorales bacterium]
MTRQLLVLANRLPISRSEDAGAVGWRPSAGGLTTALRPVMNEAGGSWVGWDDGVEDVPSRVAGLDVRLHPVTLSRSLADGYYHGFANRTLWPLLHDLVVQPVIDRAWWRSYEEANAAFVAEAKRALDGDKPLVWVHDYHLMLAPEMLRQEFDDCPIGFFLHVPFPPPELVARLPWRTQLLNGVLGADTVTFHTERYRDNFIRSVLRLTHGASVEGTTLVLPDGRRVLTSSRPISIDAQAFDEIATSEATRTELAELRQQFAGRRVFMGVDRLDYTKGIRHRLKAIESLLERNRDLRSRFAFIQIAVPSRANVSEYRELRQQVEGEVGRINGRFTEPGSDVPVHYLYRGLSRTSLSAYYQLADVLCVTPLKDGMNLVAKEFVVSQDAGGCSGALLLSEFTGAILEFDDAIGCNPFDVEGLSLRMESALALDEAYRRERLARMAAHVRQNDVHAWVAGCLTDIEEGFAARGSSGAG